MVLSHERTAREGIDPQRHNLLVLYVSPRTDAHKHRDGTTTGLHLWEVILDAPLREAKDGSGGQCGNEYSYVGLHNS